MKVLEIRGGTGTSKILIGERIQNLPFYIPGARTIFVTDQTVRRLFPDVFSGYVTIDKRAILDAVRRDKKRTGAKIKFVFLKGIGEPAIEDLDFEELEGYIHDLR
ncbi:MAG: hypothetical protein ABSG19_00485 [Candidatus Aminicenantales bacterium]